MARQKLTTITDPSVISLLCSIQQQFVSTWNQNEENWTHPPNYLALPHGAEYSGFIHPAFRGKKGACFWLPDKSTCISLVAKRGWKHWHKGWSFKRNPLGIDDIRKVAVAGSVDEFHRWVQKTADVQPPAEPS